MQGTSGGGGALQGGVGVDSSGNLLLSPAAGGFLRNSIAGSGIQMLSSGSNFTQITNTATGFRSVVFPDASGTVLVTGNGIGSLQTKRITTGSIGATTRADVTVTWSTTFADASYTTTCSVVETTVVAGTQSLVFERIHTVNNGSVVASVFNGTGGALTGTLNCTAIHD